MRLRIISGELKGRLINVPQSKEIRPTTDRVRETLFNILNNKIDFEGIKVLDLYSGSGSLGIECISRGAGEVHFVERDLFIYKNLLQNISNLKIDERCKAFNNEASRFSQNASHFTYDLIIADPPFFKDDIYKVVANLKVNRYFSDEGFIIIERSIQTKSLDTENFLTEPFKIIGDACLYEIKY